MFSETGKTIPLSVEKTKNPEFKIGDRLLFSDGAGPTQTQAIVRVVHLHTPNLLFVEVEQIIEQSQIDPLEVSGQFLTTPRHLTELPFH